MIILLTYLSYLLTSVYLLVLVYMTRGWLAIKKPLLKTVSGKVTVTILIAARNEEDNIGNTIEGLLAQDYPRHLTEIIIADDHSTDRTAEIIRSYAGRGVQLLQLREEKALNSYKKKAISEAIRLSSGELLVATDADCHMEPKWLSTIVSYYEAYDPVMISSPVTYYKEQSFFERMQTLEFSYLIGMGASFIGNKRASTCNGANLAYRRDVFDEVGGFKGIDDLASGDDELLLQKVAEIYPGRIGFLKDHRAVVYTYAKPDLKTFMQQRRRWASKSTRYKDKKVVALAVSIWLFNVSILVNFAGAFFSPALRMVLLWQLLLKFLFEAVFLLAVNSFFKRMGLVIMLVAVIPVHVLYFIYVGLMGNNRKYDWKGRHVK